MVAINAQLHLVRAQRQLPTTSTPEASDAARGAQELQVRTGEEEALPDVQAKLIAG